MTSNRSTLEQPSVHESFYGVAGRAARATFDAPRIVRCERSYTTSAQTASNIAITTNVTIACNARATISTQSHFLFYILQQQQIAQNPLILRPLDTSRDIGKCCVCYETFVKHDTKPCFDVKATNSCDHHQID